VSVRVLIIDDSALMRKHLRQILESARYEVMTARNGEEGLEKIADFDPAVVTLDINMPVMDGLTCLSLVMQHHPRPVVMVSSLTEKGALATFEALELGAVDYVSKPGGTVSLNIRNVADELLDKVGAAVNVQVNKSRGLRQRLMLKRKHRSTAPLKRRKRPIGVVKKLTAKYKLIIIGVSTGGPGTVEEIIIGLPADFPTPILIAQHMPARFTRVFAERLNKGATLEVLEVSRPTRLVAGQILIAHGDADITLTKRSGHIMATSVPASSKCLWHPSVKRMVQSAVDVCDAKSIICVQLTGMGNDGAAEMAQLHSMGAKTIAESEETAVVYGMPRELVELGGADYVLPSYEVAGRLIRLTMQNH